MGVQGESVSFEKGNTLTAAGADVRAQAQGKTALFPQCAGSVTSDQGQGFSPLTPCPTPGSSRRPRQKKKKNNNNSNGNNKNDTPAAAGAKKDAALYLCMRGFPLTHRPSLPLLVGFLLQPPRYSAALRRGRALRPRR